MRSKVCWLVLAGSALASSVQASETISYTYDALGRLTKVARTGTVNNGANACYTYDPANNRTNVNVAPSADCTFGNGGGGNNQTPTPVNDSGSQQKCTTAVYNVTANDTDPDGDYPLTVTNVTGSGNWGIVSASEISFTSLNSTGAALSTMLAKPE